MQGIDYTFCELREKEVINIADGRRLGRIIDLGMHCSGRIVGVIVPGEKKFFKNLTGSDNIFIPWKNVLKIGDDVILIELVGACNMEVPPPPPQPPQPPQFNQQV